MFNEVFLGMLNNMALLLLLVLVYDLLYPLVGENSLSRSILSGFLLGLIGLIVMITPWKYNSGIIFDTRSILLCISGMYFGLIPTAVAAVMAIVFRIFQGGSGMITGILVIVSSSCIGLIWYKYGKNHSGILRLVSFYIIGLVVHVVMLLLMFTLPNDTALPLLRQITLPVMIVYPIGVVLVGTLLNIRIDQIDSVSRLKESEKLLMIEIGKKEDAYKSLVEKENIFRKYILHAPIGIFVCDEAGNYTEVNPAAEKVTGYSRDELLSMNIIDLASTEHNAQYMASFQKVLTSGKVSEVLPFVRKDGKNGFWTLNAVMVSENRFMGFTNDITSLKRAENAANREREQLLVTLRSIGDGVITTDIDGNILLINKVAEKLTGWNYLDAVGKPLESVFQIIHGFTGQKCENIVHKVVQSKSIVELANHTMLISKSGERYSIADSGAPIFNQQSDIIGVVIVFRDTTQEELINDHLRQVTKLDSLSILAGGIAHDFNNLLSGIFGYVELSRDAAQTGADNLEYLEKLLPIFDRARGLTQQLLTFSKGGSLARESRDIKDLIEESVSFALSGSNIETLFTIDPDLWTCYVDAHQIGQVVDNIVINAQQAMPSGGQLLVTAENTELNENTIPYLHPGSYVMISIKDSGEGISSDILDKIFDPFFTTKKKGPWNRFGNLLFNYY